MANRVRFVDNVGVSAFGSTAGNDALINVSSSLNNIVFTKGDNSQFTITVDTGSGGGFFNTSSLMITASIAGNDLTFTKGDGTTFIVTLPSSSADTGSLLTTGSVAGNTLTFTKGDGTTFDLTVSGGGGGNGIFTQIDSTDQFQATSSLKISGSTLFETPLAHSTNLTASDGAAKYALVVSESVWHRNANVGVPTTNPWKSGLDGTFFNRFDHNTDIAEMLRYMIGVLSGSSIGGDFADTEPNTRTFNSVSTAYSGTSNTTKSSLFNGVLGTSYENARLSQHWTSSAFIDFSKTASYREAQQYYIAKGFIQESDRGTFGNDTGTNPFHGSYASRIPNSILASGQFANFTFTNTSIAAGSTAVSSNAGDSQLFGLGELTSGNATEYFVQIASSQSYSDNYSNQNPDTGANNFTTSSVITYSIDSFTTSNGLTLAKINPPSAELPAAFQDGKFASVSGPITGRKYTGGATSNTSISSSGYYKMHDVVVGLKTGSMSVFETKNGSDSSVSYYTPNPYQASFVSAGALQDITDGAPTAIISDVLTRTVFTATSRSLSGAPYILTAGYTFTYNTQVSKSFDPGYNIATTPIQTSNSTNTWSSIGSVSLSNTSVSINSSGVATNSATAGVFPAESDPSGRRSTGVIPHIDDITFLSSSLTFSLTTNSNVVSSMESQKNQNYNLAFRTTARNWKNSSQTSTSATQNFYDATLFGQPSSSGSMAIYRQAQGYDGGSLTGTTEQFTGEDFRIKINNNLLVGTYAGGDKFTTDTFNLDPLNKYDLQVKPGFLVKPSGSYGYWLTNPDSSTDYKYYGRAFQTDGSVKTSLSVNVGKTLVTWDSTTNDSVAVAVMFQAAATGINTGGGARVRPIIYDFATLSGTGNISNNQSQDDQLNPFSTAIDIGKNNEAGSGLSGTTYTMPLTSTKNQVLNGTYTDYIILVRYKGDPSPVTNITISY